MRDLWRLQRRLGKSAALRILCEELAYIDREDVGKVYGPEHPEARP